MTFHHYVSAFHLAEFTVKRTRHGHIHVLDLQNARQWKSSVNDAGGISGFNAVEGVAGMGVDEMDQFFSKSYETPAAPVLRQINDRKSLPDPDAFRVLLKYIALIGANNPAPRSALAHSQNQALKFLGQMMAADPEHFEAARESLRDAGVPLLGELEHAELQRRVESGPLDYTPSTLAYLRGLGQQVNQLLMMLEERQWSLIVSSDDLPAFICSDHPVTLVRKRTGGEPEQSAFPPGFAEQATEVTVPLGPSVALLGTYEPLPPLISATVPVIGEVNRRGVRSATRFVYSLHADFVYSAQDGSLHNSEDLLR